MKITVNNEIGREVNPYMASDKNKGLDQQKLDVRYNLFEETVQSYPAPGFQDTALGEWVEAELVWEYYRSLTEEWVELGDTIIWREDDATRQIWKAKAEGESVEQAASEYANRSYPNGLDGESAFKGFIAGAKWREENPVT